MPRPPTRSFSLSQALRINWKMAVLAVITAITIWMLQALNKEYYTQISLPITLDYNIEGLVMVAPPQEEVVLGVRGEGWELLRRSSNIKADPLIISLEVPTQSKFILRASLSSIFAPQLKPIYLESVFLDTLFFDIQRRTHKTIYITLDSTQVALKEDHRIISSIRIVPDTFLLSGPEQKVAHFPDTYSLSLSTEEPLEAPFKESIRINLEEPMFRQAYPSDVEVSFEVARFEHKIIQVPLARSGFPVRSRRQIVLSDTLITLRYTAQSDHLSSITPEQFIVVVNYSDRDRRKRILTPRLIGYPEEYISRVELLQDTVRYSYVRR